MIRPERQRARREIDSLAALHAALNEKRDLSHHVLHALDLHGEHDWERVTLKETLFLGCRFEDHAHRLEVEQRGAYVFPPLDALPYRPYRAQLYSVEELLAGYDEGGYFHTRDYAIYAHFEARRRAECGVPIVDALAQRLHDHAIDDALEDLLERLEDRLKVVGVMGGHSTSRDDPWYATVARLCHALTRRGYFIASGGGPGIMEAANLGAYLAHFARPEVVDEAIGLLAAAPRYSDGLSPGEPGFEAAIERYLSTAQEVIARFGPVPSEAISARFERDKELPGESLAIPTWFYGHEPSNLFSLHVAKYFANSIREDGLLAISLGGVIYAPGSAGTLQEVFMDLAQNHYTTFSWRSPMVFLGERSWGAWFELISAFVRQHQGEDRPYAQMLSLVDDEQSALLALLEHPPEPLLTRRGDA